MGAGITADDIRALQHDAVVAGDGPMADTCNLALAGDSASWRECERAIRAAEAMADRDD